MAEELIQDTEQALVESLSTYVASLARLPVGRFAEADAKNILDAVRSTPESTSETRLLLPGLLTMVDIRLTEDQFYVSGRLRIDQDHARAADPSSAGCRARVEACFDRPRLA